jgi:hypothetical protein
MRHLIYPTLDSTFYFHNLKMSTKKVLRVNALLMFASLVLLIGCGGSNGATSGGGGNDGGGNGGGGGSVPAPLLTQLTPPRVTTRAPVGLHITGKNFTSSSSVLFDGNPVGSIVHSSSSIDVLIDTFSIAQLHTVQVSDPSGGESNVLTYDVYEPQTGPRSFAGQPSQASIQNVIGSGTLADFNGDGRSDVVTFEPPAGDTTLRLTIRFGNVDGTFSDPASTGVTFASEPTQVLAADLNRDGRVDLIAIFQGSYQSLLNDGLGHLTRAGSGSLPGTGFGRGVVGDFNGDGVPDFIVDTGETPTLAVLFGLGDGNFGPATLLGNGTRKAARILAADLNGDGVTDVLYSAYDPIQNDSIQLYTLLFHPGGSSTDTITKGVGTNSWSFVLGDFNNDRVPDLFVVDAAGIGQSFAGNGDGSFSAEGNAVPASDLFLVTPPFVSGDFDDDGNVDIVTRLSIVGPDVILFLWGDGHGNFTRQLIASDQSFYLSTGDINGDGLTDIVSVASEGFGYQTVVLGRHDRNYPSAKLLLNAPQGAISFGDVFNDGSNDILVSGSGDCVTSTGTPGIIYHFEPNGVPVAQSTTPACTSVLADLNGDGIADLVGMVPGTLFLFRGDGTGSFQPMAQMPIPRQTIQDVMFRDMDRDGNVDIVLNGSIMYGSANFQFDTVTFPSSGVEFVVGDFDGDGMPDIGTSTGMLFGNGGRTFTAPTGTGVDCSSAYARAPAIGDLNGDGKDDLVCGSATSYLVSIYLSEGRTGFRYDNAIAIPGYSPIVSTINVADFNGDGRADIAIGTGGPDAVLIYSATATGHYQISSYAIGVNPISSMVGDFNHDGTPDLAFVNFLSDFKPPAIEVLLHK